MGCERQWSPSCCVKVRPGVFRGWSLFPEDGVRMAGLYPNECLQASPSRELREKQLNGTLWEALVCSKQTQWSWHMTYICRKPIRYFVYLIHQLLFQIVSHTLPPSVPHLLCRGRGLGIASSLLILLTAGVSQPPAEHPASHPARPSPKVKVSGWLCSRWPSQSMAANPERSLSPKRGKLGSGLSFMISSGWGSNGGSPERKQLKW